jgi:transcriptional regulator with XRE-family HTH domain
VRKVFSHALKEIRQKRNWRQKDVAQITGFHIHSIHKYEINLRKPSWDFLVALVEKGKVDPRELFYCGTGDTKKAYARVRKKKSVS